MKIFSTLIFTIVAGSTMAQTLVGTAPTNKTAIVEEFTGVNCPNCPDGHTVAAGILSTYPGQALLLGYHPSNSNFTSPLNNSDEDLRRNYLDAFYATSYVGSRFMPSAMINRREWGTDKTTGRSAWSGHVQTIIAESSPVNVGMSSSYDASTEMLTVDVEVYYTSNVTNPNSLYVHLTEDDLVVAQSGSGGGANYVHKHVFREELNTGQWGDAITGATTSGTLYTAQFTLDMSGATATVDMSKAHVLALVYDSSTEEVYTGAEVLADGGITNSVATEEVIEAARIYPNPTNGPVIFNVVSSKNTDAQISVLDVLGKTIESFNYTLTNGENFIQLNTTSNLEAGIYFVNVTQGKEQQTLKLIVE